MSASVSDTRLHCDHVWMCVNYGTNAATPKWQDEIVLLLSLANLANSIGEERLIRMVVGIKLEERLAPVVTAVALLEVVICQYANVFSAAKNAIFMPVVDDLMSAIGHHLTKLDYLLSICTGIKLFASNCVWKS